jgi:hypothetical protein
MRVANGAHRSAIDGLGQSLMPPLPADWQTRPVPLR